MLLKKSEGNLKNIRKGSINSPDTSLIMMGFVSSLLKSYKIVNLGIYVKGTTKWKKFSLRRLLQKLEGDLSIKFFRDITSEPHNGCSLTSRRRKRKRRRLKLKIYKKYKIGRKTKKDITEKKFTIKDKLTFKILKKSKERYKKSKKFYIFLKGWGGTFRGVYKTMKHKRIIK